MAQVVRAAAVAYANHGAGRSRQLTRSAREIRAREIVAQCTVAALHIAVVDNAGADALSRSPSKESGGDQFPDRELRPKFRSMVPGRCWAMDVDVMSDGGGLNAWCDRFRSPARSASEAPFRGVDCGSSRAWISWTWCWIVFVCPCVNSGLGRTYVYSRYSPGTGGSRS